MWGIFFTLGSQLLLALLLRTLWAQRAIAALESWLQAVFGVSLRSGRASYSSNDSVEDDEGASSEDEDGLAAAGLSMQRTSSNGSSSSSSNGRTPRSTSGSSRYSSSSGYSSNGFSKGSSSSSSKGGRHKKGVCWSALGCIVCDVQICDCHYYFSVCFATHIHAVTQSQCMHSQRSQLHTMWSG
jgi:hypothetical protein